jgi:hypothetical protein
VAIWYIFHRFGKLCQEKSGNPGVKDPDSLCIEKADKGEIFYRRQIISLDERIFANSAFQEMGESTSSWGDNVIIFWQKMAEKYCPCLTY